jgi:hypothetical protein
VTSRARLSSGCVEVVLRVANVSGRPRIIQLHPGEILTAPSVLLACGPDEAAKGRLEQALSLRRNEACGWSVGMSQ